MANQTAESPCPENFLGPGDGLVTWQAAVWGILPIAINSMLSNNGMVLAFPSRWGIALRSSPILCLFDAVEIVFTWLAFILFNADSISTAAKRVARLRFKDVQNQADEQSLGHLREHFWLVQVVFLLTVFIQAIKLFAMSGVAGTQVCAMFFLVSWLSSQALIFAAGSDWKSTSLPIIRPGPLADIESQGLLHRLPLHIAAVFYHCIWLDGLAQDVFWVDADDEVFSPRHFDPGQSLFLILCSIIVYAVLPFLVYHSDLDSLINISADKLDWFRFGSFSYNFLGAAWDSCMERFVIHPPFRDSAYYGTPHLLLFLEVPLCAFNIQCRSAMIGSIVVTQFLSLWTTWLLFGDKPEQDFGDWLWHFICVFLIVGFFPDSILNRIKSTFRSINHTIPHLRRKYFVYTAIAIIVLIYAIVPFFSLQYLLQTSAIITYLLLHAAKHLSKTKETRFSPTIAGISFVLMNAAIALLWYWQAWPAIKHGCTLQPAWSIVPFG